MASFKQGNLLTGKKAGADLSGSQHRAVKQDSNGDIVLAGAGEGLGFLCNKPESGDFAEVAVSGGGALGIAAASINEGDELASDANGALVAAISGDRVIAIALNGASSGDHFEVMPVFFDKA